MSKASETTCRIGISGISIASLTFLVSSRLSHRLFTKETYLDDALLAMITAAITIAFLCQRELRKRAVEEHRQRTFKATMTTVHDILGNFLNAMQIVRLDAEGNLPEESIQLFDQVTADVQEHLKALSDIETPLEKPMAIGIGIHYLAVPHHTQTGQSRS